MTCIRPGFTLIEMLVASTLVIFLLSLVTGTMLHINRITTRTNAALTMHDAASAFQRSVQDRLQSVHHGGAWHCSADAGTDAAWNTGDESVSLTWLANSASRSDAGKGLYQSDQDDMTWFRLSWRGPKHLSRPGVFLSRSAGVRTNVSRGWKQYPDPNYNNVAYIFSTWSQPRRDRRRDLNDNDWRLIEGMKATIYNDYLQPGGLYGDGAVLDANETLCFGSDLAITDLTLSWIDRGGWKTTASAATGISRRDATGKNVPMLGTAWNSQTRITLDGLFLDGRTHTLAPDTRDILACRPSLVQLSFVVNIVQPSGSPRTREDLSQRFVFSIPVAFGQPAP